MRPYRPVVCFEAYWTQKLNSVSSLDRIDLLKMVVIFSLQKLRTKFYQPHRAHSGISADIVGRSPENTYVPACVVLVHGSTHTL